MVLGGEGAELLSVELEVLVVEVLSVLVLVLVELELAVEPPFLFELPEYRSEYQPPPFRMKLPEVIARRACAWPQEGHSLMGSSLIFCTRSNW